MTFEELTQALNEAMDQEDTLAIERLVAEMQPPDLAEFVRHESPEVSLKLLTHLPLEERAEAFGYLELEKQCELALKMTEEGLSQLFVHMNSDERADLFNELPEERQEGILRRMAQDEREDIRRLASYEEGTAGAVMTSDYVTVPAGVTVGRALDIVRQTAPNAETIYQIYILDQAQQLLGTLSLRQLILAKPEAVVDGLMTTDLVSINVHEEQEEASRLISRYDLLALPVVDDQQRLVGIVTYDDAMDVAEEEATEDIHKSASVGPLDEGFGKARITSLYRRRVNWLVLLVFANILSGAGIAFYEETIEAYVVLVFFLPLLVASGGNAGSQASTLMIRGLATGDVGARDWGKLLSRELVVSASLGLTMAATIAGIGFWRGGMDIAQVVAYSMFAIVVVGSLIGMSLPFMLNKLGWDPATASAPLVTSIADIVGVLIYFAIATSILDLG
ncbi:magnesium transporter [Marinospirillum alkaliphilum]|uniref:Magnesium transporter MgtE n=1 Tax=Marinospirillum alkaliphilum DSM 21637 TaxID=1122209 RepID=A0A1K1WSA3_9GAMM|nr:magnesium transporter [Marinospirillum alkaliphilum]SFX40273.1 magnesium transporter [Marinospirillum alkaliphilum DSM 21637]